jgi:tetratricopeptide (TPR) repeat protein
MRISKGRLGATLAALAVALAARPAAAEAPDGTVEASTHFQRATEALQRGELTRAAAEYEAAQALSPNPVVLYNLGQINSALGQSVQAESALEAYLASDAARADPARRKDVEKLLAFNAQRIGTLVVDLAPADAVLELDGARAAAGRLRLTAGRHVLVTKRAGYTSSVVNVDVRAGEESGLGIQLEPLSAASAPPAEAPPVARAERQAPSSPSAAEIPERSRAKAKPVTRVIAPLGWVGIAAIGTGGAAVVASALLGLKAYGANAESKGYCDASGCDPRGLELRSQAVEYGNWATGLFFSGAAVAAAGTALFVLEGHTSATNHAHAPRLSAAVDPRRGAAITLGIPF